MSEVNGVTLVLASLVGANVWGCGHAGKILGIAFGPEGWAILLVFTLVWAVFYAATKDVGDGRGSGEDSGLTL